MHVEFIYAIAWTAIVFWMGRYHGLEVAECRQRQKDYEEFSAQMGGQLRASLERLARVPSDTEKS